MPICKAYRTHSWIAVPLEMGIFNTERGHFLRQKHRPTEPNLTFCGFAHRSLHGSGPQQGETGPAFLYHTHPPSKRPCWPPRWLFEGCSALPKAPGALLTQGRGPQQRFPSATAAIFTSATVQQRFVGS